MIALDQTRRDLLRIPIPRTRLNRSKKKRRGSYAPDLSIRASIFTVSPSSRDPSCLLFPSHAYSQPALRWAQIVMGARGALERLALEADRGGELVQLPYGLGADHVALLARLMPPDWVHQDHLSSSCGLWIRTRDPLRRAAAFRDGPLSHRTGLASFCCEIRRLHGPRTRVNTAPSRSVCELLLDRLRFVSPLCGYTRDFCKLHLTRRCHDR
jgi:hypothetical protein